MSAAANELAIAQASRAETLKAATTSLALAMQEAHRNTQNMRAIRAIADGAIDRLETVEAHLGAAHDAMNLLALEASVGG